MTLLVSWIAVDTHGPASVYIASDSRVSWTDRVAFDFGRKVFAFSRHPDILGYCGDVLFPSMALAQIREMADLGLLFPDKATGEQKFAAIKGKLVQQFERYPSMAGSTTADTVQVLHACRDSADHTAFSCWLAEWRRGEGWSEESIPLPANSGLLRTLGSGSSEFKENYERYRSSPTGGTSRNIFHCFCDTLFSARDMRCGGAPQLVGVYRKPGSSALSYGIIRDGRRYLLGAEIDDLREYDAIEWRNDLFERCDGAFMRPLPDAQRQPDPLRRPG